MTSKVIGTVVLAIMFAAVCFGLLATLKWKFNQEEQATKEMCQKNAKLIDATDWQADGTQCILVRNGKAIELQK